MTLDPIEARRKAVHIGMGFLALALAKLHWQEAALAGSAAVVFNLVVLPRVGGGSLMRPRDLERGFPVGILMYPVVVLALILLFHGHLEFAAAGWGYLAFGDGFATLAGKAFGGRRLPFNHEKSWAGFVAYVLFGSAAASFFWSFVSGTALDWRKTIVFLAAGLAGAIVESLPSELDDNIFPPLVASGVLFVLLQRFLGPGPLLPVSNLRLVLMGAGINLAVAAASLVLKVIRPSGALAGFFLGTVVYTFGGARVYALLWIFFVIGTLATRFGRKRKEALGKAEEAGGRRGASNVLANVSVAAFFSLGAALDPGRASFYSLAAAAALATALMDTVGTEVGQAIRSRTVLLPDFREVSPGTDGAVSIAGTAGGFLAAGFLAAAAVDLAVVKPWGAFALLAGAFVGTMAESLMGRAGAPWRVSNGHVLNFYNTLIGAVTALAIAMVFGLAMAKERL